MDWMRTLKPDAIIVDPFKVQTVDYFNDGEEFTRVGLIRLLVSCLITQLIGQVSSVIMVGQSYG